MVQTSGSPLPAVIDDLLRQPQCYAFAQVTRLLRLWAGPRNAQELESFMLNRMRFRPELSLGFAASDVTALDVADINPHLRQPFRQARVTAAFLGLYGVSSPLPKFYTEVLLAEMTEDRSVLRDFLDLVNNAFYRMQTGLSSYSDPLRRSFSAFDPKARHMLMSLASFGGDSLAGRLPDELLFLRYAGFFFQTTRTASGLRAILADASGCAATHVRCNVPRLAKVPQEQLFRLGQSAVLGEDGVLGDAVPCFEGKIEIEFSMLDESTFRAILPGAPLSRLLHALVRHYCREPLDYAVTAALAPGEAAPLCLGGDAGGRFACLGLDAWLGCGGKAAEAPLPKAEALFPAGFCWENTFQV
jgi:type VI secretion system protein ImpH